MRRRLGILLLLSIFCVANAQIEISATADRTSISKGEQVVITIQIQSTKQLGRIAIPEIPPNESFIISKTNQNQSQNSSISIVNGQMTQTNTINYLIYYYASPKKEGPFTFPPILFKIDNANYTTQAIPISVTKEQVTNSEVKIRLSTSKKNVVVGEQLLLNFMVAVKDRAPVPLSGQEFSPCLEKLEKNLSSGFSVNRLFIALPKDVPQRLDGEMYHTFTLNYSLVPLAPGSITISPVGFDYVIQKRVASRSSDPFFDDFFGGASVQQIPKSAISNTLVISVNSLPQSPNEYSGAVGNFTLNTSIDPKTVSAGDAATVKVQIKGNTRLGSLPDIKLPSIANCEVFPPEKQNGVDTTSSGLNSYRTYKYLVIPSQEGQVVIPSLSLTFFNPESNSYKTIKTDSLVCAVTKGNGTQRKEPTYTTRNQSEILERGKDIRYIKVPGSIHSQSTLPPFIIWLLFPLPLLGFMAALLYKIQKQSHANDPTKLLKRKAFMKAQKKLDILHNPKNETKSSQNFLGNLAALLEEYITNTFRFNALGKTQDELIATLKSKGLDDSASLSLQTFFNETDRYRFGGDSLQNNAQSELITTAKKLLLTLENAAKKEKK